MKRVIILGCGGAGKSTLARALGERARLPVVHLDRVFWKAGWIEPSREEFAALHDASLLADRWIIDGNYSRTMDQRVAVADTIVVLDLPRLTCLRGVLVRWLKHRGTTRPDMPAGCPEKIDWAFIKWIWNFRARSRPKQMELVDSLHGTKDIHVLESRRAIRRWLSDLPEKNA